MGQISQELDENYEMGGTHKRKHLFGTITNPVFSWRRFEAAFLYSDVCDACCIQNTSNGVDRQIEIPYVVVINN